MTNDELNLRIYYGFLIFGIITFLVTFIQNSY
jgi:hypothetical protein